MIKDDTPNHYMVLLHFRSQVGLPPAPSSSSAAEFNLFLPFLLLQDQADNFYHNYNSIKFNSLETEVCHVCYVSRVESVKASSVSPGFASSSALQHSPCDVFFFLAERFISPQRPR